MHGENLTYFTDISLILFVAVALAFIASYFRQSLITGYILAGILVGPHALGWIEDIDQIRRIAEIGLIFLMFALGLEFSLKKLQSIKKVVFGAGTAQVVGTILVGAILSHLLGFSWTTGIFIGCVMSLSSTAVVTKELGSRREVDSPQGRISIGILIFQDLAVIPMMIFLPVMQSVGPAVFQDLALAGIKTIGFLGAAYVIGRFVLPVVLQRTMAVGGKELLVLATFMIVFVSASLSQWFGLSMALGAFVVGALLAETDFKYQIHHVVVPFREIFMSLFFVAIGLLFNIDFLLAHLWQIIPLAIAIPVINAIICSVVVLFFGYPLRIAIFSALVLAEMGEFSFILIQMGSSNNLISENVYQLLLSLVAVTLLLTPLVFQVATQLTRRLEALQFLKGQMSVDQDEKEKLEELNNHVIVCGFGPVGQNLAYHLNKHGIPYVITDMNADSVKENKKKGFPIYFGDASSAHMLEKMGIEKALGIAITMIDPSGIDALIREAKRLNPKIFILARARYVDEIGGLLAKGVSEVISEELEVSQIISERFVARTLR